MSVDTSNILDSLKEELKANRVIPFIGAGVSRAVEKKEKDSAKTFNPLFPSWKEFLVLASKKLRGEKNFTAAKDIITLLKLSRPKYLEAAQIAYDSLGVSLWNRLLRETFEVDEDKADSESLELARLVWQLGSNLVFTTNVDEVLEWKIVKDEKINILDTQTDEFPELQREETIKPTLIYLHGRIQDKANIVFTLEQYKDFYERQKNAAKLETLRSFLARKTFLFIGFSLDDPYFVEQLEYIHKTYNGASDFFYVLVRKEEKGKLNHLSYVKEIEYETFGEPLLKVMRGMRDFAGEANNGKTTPPEPEIPKPAKDKPFFNVPYNSKGKEFVGRAGKTKDIRELLGQNGVASIGQAVSVKGFGGLGKTQLAVEYAHEYRAKYKNGVFWLVADENIDNQLLQIADRKGWINQFDKTVNQLDVAKAKFLELSECLIIFDNVESQEDIKDYLPKTDLRTHILITSRYKQSSFRQIDLELLERDESRELLLKISNRNSPEEVEKEHLENILETLGDIPLAIELVGGYLAEHENVTFAKYHQFLDEVPLDKLEKEFPEGSFTNHDRSISRTLRISEKLIKEKSLMVEILKVLAWSGSSSMGTSLLQALVGTKDEFKFETAIGDALKLRLLKKDDITERYAIHRLLAKVIRHEKLFEKHAEWHQKIARNLINWFDNRKEDSNHFIEFEAEIEHLEEWQRLLVLILPNESIRLITLITSPLIYRGNFNEATKLLETGLKLYKSEKLDDSELLADLLNYLGNGFGYLGKYQKALEHVQKALKIRQNLYNEEHLSIADSLNDIGTMHTYLGNYKEGLKHKVRALNIRKKLLDEPHLDIATSMSNISISYSYLHQYQTALDYNFQALIIRQQLLGKQHPDIATSLNGIGNALGYLKNHKKALNYKLAALQMRKELFGEKHPTIATSLNNIGISYLYLKEHREASKYFKSALKMRQEILGSQHPRTVSTCKNLILLLSKMGDTNTTQKLAEEFLNYVPYNDVDRKLFEHYSINYQKKK